MADVVISYSHDDRDRVRKLAAKLAVTPYSVWWDDKLLAKDDYSERIDEELHNAKAVIVIWSPNSITSKWVKAEAQKAGSKLIPVRTRGVPNNSIPLPYGILHTPFLNDWNAILAAIAGMESGTSEVCRGTLPFPRVRRSWVRSRPFTRVRVELGSEGVDGTEIIMANTDAEILYEAEPGELILTDIQCLVDRLSDWMDPADFEAFKKDQLRAQVEFGRNQWAAARVPIRLNSSHPAPQYKNMVFRPVMKTSRVKDEVSPNIWIAEISYVEESTSSPSYS